MMAAQVIALIDPSLLPATLILLSVVLTLIITVRERQHFGSARSRSGLGQPLSGQYRRGLAGHRASRRESGLAVALAVTGGIVAAIVGWVPAPLKRNLTAAGAARILRGRSPAHRSAVAAARPAAPLRVHPVVSQGLASDVWGALPSSEHYASVACCAASNTTTVGVLICGTRNDGSARYSLGCSSTLRLSPPIPGASSRQPNRCPPKRRASRSRRCETQPVLVLRGAGRLITLCLKHVARLPCHRALL